MKKIRIIMIIIIVTLFVFRSIFLTKDSSKDVKNQDYFKTTIRGGYLTDVLTDKMYSDQVTPVHIKITEINSGIDIRLVNAKNINQSFSCPWIWVNKVGEYEVCSDGPYNYDYILVARQPIYKLTPTTVEGYWTEDYEDGYIWEE